jgi:gamma-glutamyltranspeptidase
MTQATTHGMVCAAQPEAAEAAADVLRAGGNVVDAAIAAALVQTVVDPQICGIAGMGNLQIDMPGQGIHPSIDFHGRAPLTVRPDMWVNRILHATERALCNQGYTVKRHAQSDTFAWVHAIRLQDGVLDGGADPATGGLAIAV